MTERLRNGGGADWQIAEPNPDRSESRVANCWGYDRRVRLTDYSKHLDLTPPRVTSRSIAASAALLPLGAAP
jgi:hypothetical protein